MASDNTNLRDRVIIITGASSGIGAACALACGARGMRIVLTARRERELQAVASQAEAAGGNVLVCPADVGDARQVEQVVAATMAGFGRVDALLASAGLGCPLPTAEVTDRQMSGTVEVNLLGVMRCAHAVLPHMIAQRSGHILTVSSVIVGLVWPGDAVYAATKAGVHRFSRGLRHEVRRHGIRVTDVMPGVLDTPLNRNLRGLPKSSVTRTAEEIVGVLRRPRPLLVTPRWYLALMAANRAFPGSVDGLIQRLCWFED